MRFLHLSDLHVGRRLSGLSLLEDQRAVLGQAVEMAGDCDAVLLAGDLYDKPQPSAEAIRVMSDFLVSLRRLGKPVFAVSGNHDAPEQVAYCRELLGECGVFLSPVFDGALRRHVLRDAYGAVEVYLMPFLRPSAVRPFFGEVRTFEDAVRAALSTVAPASDARRVLVAHQYVRGGVTCDSELLSLGGADEVSAALFDGFDYVALGHLHSPQRLSGGRVRYCGSPLKYSLSEERQRKAALVVELGAAGECAVTARPFSPLHELRTARGTLEALTAPECSSEDYVYAELTDEGALMDPVGALRLTYPNLIGMRFAAARSAEGVAEAEVRDAERRTPLEHFSAFYEAQNGQPPDERRLDVMRQVIGEAEAMGHASNPA